MARVDQQRTWLFAPGQEIIHRDIKPSNTMLDQHGTVKVLDFGIARIVGAGLTQMSMVIGTPGYMSPEQIEGGPIDARSDVFALGAVMYELLCYHKAFNGDTPHAVMHQVLTVEPRRLTEALSDLSPRLAAIVDTALKKDASARYSDMTALETALGRERLALETSSVDPFKTEKRERVASIGESHRPDRCANTVARSCERGTLLDPHRDRRGCRRCIGTPGRLCPTRPREQAIDIVEFFGRRRPKRRHDSRKPPIARHSPSCCASQSLRNRCARNRCLYAWTIPFE